LKLELHIKYFYELLLLFNQNKRSIIGWYGSSNSFRVRSFLGELGLSKNYVEIISNILKLYTGLNSESKDFLVSKEEFERLMMFLMKIDTDSEKGNLKRTLGNSIYQIISPSASDELPDIMMNEEVDMVREA
jgi:hypothetical protein